MRLTINAPTHPPIAQAEYLYQQRSIDKRRRRWWVALPGVLMTTLSTFAVAFIFIISFGEATGLFRIRSMPPELYVLALIVWLGIPGFVLLPTVVVMHFGLMLRTILWTSNSIPREKISGTWDLLLLTGASGREIVMGKWAATVRRALPSYLRLATMRAGMLLWFIEWLRFRFELSPTLRIDFEQYSQPMNLLMLVLGIALVFAYTLINLPVTAAMGMFTAFISKRPSINTAVAGVLRTLFFIAPIVLLFVSMWFFPSYYYYNEGLNSPTALMYNVVQLSTYTLAENGMVVSYGVTQIGDVTLMTTQNFLIIVGILSITWLYYALVTVVMLWGARRLALRQAALEQLKKR